MEGTYALPRQGASSEEIIPPMIAYHLATNPSQSLFLMGLPSSKRLAPSMNVKQDPRELDIIPKPNISLEE